MSEPTLLQTFTEIRLDVAQELGYTRTTSKWNAERTSEIENIANAGYRRFLFLAMAPNGTPHRWSFLRPTTTMTIWGVTTGTTSGAPSYDGTTYSTVTATADKFYPSMVGKPFVFDTSGTAYTVAVYVSATVIKVTGDASGETSGDTFTMTPDGDYQLPDDFGSILDDFYLISASNTVRKITRRGSSQILRYRAEREDDTGTPEIYGIAPLTMDGTAGQRQKVMFAPTPDAVETLTYQYSILPDKLTTSNPYPKGTELYSETIRYAALAEVERRIGKKRGFEEQYLQYLAIGVQQDALAAMPDSLGYNSDESVRNTTTCFDRTYGATITRNGSPI